jgi:hypothetical protein
MLFLSRLNLCFLLIILTISTIVRDTAYQFRREDYRPPQNLPPVGQREGNEHGQDGDEDQDQRGWCTILNPFENFGVIYLAPSAIALFTILTLYLAGNVVIIFNLHEFLHNKFRPNSFILRISGAIASFINALHKDKRPLSFYRNFIQ